MAAAGRGALREAQAGAWRCLDTVAGCRTRRLLTAPRGSVPPPRPSLHREPGSRPCRGFRLPHVPPAEASHTVESQDPPAGDTTRRKTASGRTLSSSELGARPLHKLRSPPRGLCGRSYQNRTSQSRDGGTSERPQGFRPGSGSRVLATPTAGPTGERKGGQGQESGASDLNRHPPTEGCPLGTAASGVCPSGLC